MTHAEALVFKPCILIPVYNHSAVLRALVQFLRSHDLPVLLVDDGSDAQCRELMEDLHRELDGVHLVRHERNRGKGAAVKTGLFEARRLGFTHAVQIDADGQHDTHDIARFLQQSCAHPDALVSGHPVYDESVPRHRFYFRYLCHVWVWINTLSMDIIDSMCGFRVYPVERSCELLQRHRIGDRMDFDVEFIVRWHWAGYALVQLPTRVIYPEDGISHFRLLPDNALIVLMHARLFLLMSLQAPKLFARKFRKSGD